MVYIQHNYEGDDPQPDYRNKELFIPWLKRFQKAQDHDLTKVYYEMLREKKDKLYMTRKYISDYVYSHLFDREEITIKNIRSIQRYFDIVPVVLLWKSYDEYLKRCERVEGNGLEFHVEYTNDEYEKIQKLFIRGTIEYSDNLIESCCVFEVSEDKSTEEIIEAIKEELKMIFNKN